ncbi:hypothetical protein M9H77_17973 [Catharanthus roseus]|uniref:Uncharacterized protein n=1 Tax=Catharanthus roseus TaxID=4058 RepID=A0ACC0B638_CATRO|nr:hypothetical protein M9H77_17973 [Catharanthus roseus]
MTVESRQVQLMAVHRIQSLSLRIAVMSLVVYGVVSLGQASRADAKELSGCWSLLEAWIYMYFPMFAPPVRAGARLCKPYIQRFAMLGHKTENKLIDLCIRLDTMTADEVRWTPYRSDEISDVWVSTYHGMISYFDSHPIRPQEHCRPRNNRVYMVKNVFIEALWLEAPSHLLTSTWTNIPAIPPSRCTDDYMPWFLSRTHLPIQNPCRLPRGVHMPIIAPITLQVLLDMVARELDCDDIDDATKVSRASDMIKRYHQTRR